MHQWKSILAGAVFLTAVTGGIRQADAYVCPGGTTDYATACTVNGTQLPNGTACISIVSLGAGCCAPGACKGGNCNLPPTQTACDDNNACTSNNCTTAGGGNFDPICSYPALPSGTTCDLDSNLCTLDTCNGSGTCVAGPNKDCSGQHLGDPQCQVPACHPENGDCYAANKTDGTKCDDGYDCTYSETCNNGSCGTGAGTGLLRDNTNICFDGGDFCHPGHCDGVHKACQNHTARQVGDSCNPNSCVVSHCDGNLNCVNDSCLDNTHNCPNCGPTVMCRPAQGTSGNTPCGCLDAYPYNPPN